jgi:hypothetical protein
LKRSKLAVEDKRIHCCVWTGFVAVLIVEKDDEDELSYSNKIEAPAT